MISRVFPRGFEHLVCTLCFACLVSRSVVHAQALQRGDVTIGGSASVGFLANSLSRGSALGADLSFSLTDRFYLDGSGGRFSGSREVSSLSTRASNVHQFIETGLGVQFRLQQSTSPFVDGGLAGLWGAGTETYSTSGGNVTNALEFRQVALRLGGGFRYVRTPASRWGFALFYRLYIPFYRQMSPPEPLVVLRSDSVRDRIGITVFVRF